MRLSYNRAFRAPSVINNYLDTVILNQLPLGSLNPALAGRVFNFPIVARGNKVPIPNVPSEELTEQSITAYEVGYTGIIKQRATRHRGVVPERHEERRVLHARWARIARPARRPAGRCRPFVLELLYCPPNPPAGRTCPFGPGFGLPSAYSYREFGKVRQRGRGVRRGRRLHARS